MFLSLLLFLVIILVVSVATVHAQSRYIVYSGSMIPDGLIDGVIGSEWDDAASYPNASVFFNKTAGLWLKHDGENLYVAYRFTADSANPWTAVQFTGINCMDSNADGALFGHDEYAPDGYRDINFGGVGRINVDSVQNGVGALNVDSNVVTVELKKPLNSGDSAGNDIAWSKGNYTFRIMWDSDGGGSSGGNVSHRTTGSLNSLAITSEVIPEIPSALIAGFLTASIVGVIVLKAKTKPKVTR